MRHTEDLVIYSPLQLAKREIHAFFHDQRRLIGTVAAGALLGLAGPFGTEDVMRFLPRVLYWVGLSILTFLTGSVLDAVLRPALTPRMPPWVSLPIVAAITCIAITVQILGLNALIFGFVPDMGGLTILAANVFAVSLVVTTTAYLLHRASPAPEATTPDAPPPGPRLLSRLPGEKRGGLISLTSVDHYVEVSTTAGKELVLIRLSDAMEEAAPVPGVQVHRSHWVALDHVTELTREDGKPHVHLSDGRKLPVSRTFLPAVREATSW